MGNVSISEFPFKPLYHIDSSDQKSKLFPAAPWFRQNGRRDNHIHGSLEEIDFDSFDAIILGSLNKDLLSYLPFVISRAPERVVYLDGGDDPFIRLILKDVPLYFKRERISAFNRTTISNYKFIWYFKKLMVDSFHYGLHTFPLPPFSPLRLKTLSLNLTVIQHVFAANSPKDIDVSFILRSKSNPLRTKYGDILKRLAKEKSLNVQVVTSGLDWKAYVDVILRSKISVALPGEGYDTYRYWEIPFNGGCMISPRLPIDIDNDFEDGLSALFFKDENEFIEKILRTLRDGSYDAIGKVAKRHFERYHSSTRRAEKVIAAAEEL